MLRRNIIVSAFATVALASCQCNSLRIVGDLENLPDGEITLSTLDSTLNWVPIETSTVEKGHFEFNKNINLPDEEGLVFAIGSQRFFIFAGNSNIKVKGNALRPEDIVVKGSEINDQLIEFMKGFPGRERLAEIQAQMGATANNVDVREELKKEIRSIEKTQREYIRRQIMDHADSPLGPFILFNSLSIFTFDETEDFLKAFSETIPNHKYVRFLSAEVERHRARYEALRKVSIGAEAPDFSLETAGGETVTLSKLRGKVVLVDFWASQSNECRKNNKTIVETYNKFSSKGFTVVGISIDNDAAAWLKALNDDRLNGHQVRDTDGSVAKAYVVEQIPASFLIDENGIIVSKDVSSEDIFADIENRMRKPAREGASAK